MLTPLIAALLALFDPSASDVEALRRSAPAYLTTATAREHLIGARVAAFVVQPFLVGNISSEKLADDLLAIAHHESRHTVGVITVEPGGMVDHRFYRVRVSCGVMTPKPKARCEPWELGLRGGYLAGALHLAEWYAACGGNRICALNGYAGNSDDLQAGGGIKTWQTFARRAAWLRQLRVRVAREIVAKS